MHLSISSELCFYFEMSTFKHLLYIEKHVKIHNNVCVHFVIILRFLIKCYYDKCFNPFLRFHIASVGTICVCAVLYIKLVTCPSALHLLLNV